MDRPRGPGLCRPIRSGGGMESLFRRNGSGRHGEGFRRGRPGLLGSLGGPVWPCPRARGARRANRSMERMARDQAGVRAMSRRFPAWWGFVFFAAGLAVYAVGASRSPLVDSETDDMLRVLARGADID